MPFLHRMHSLLGGVMRVSMSAIRPRISQAAAAMLRRLDAARGRDPIVWLIICGAVLVAGIALGTIMMAGEFRERAIANNERELQNAVLLLTRHFDQQFEDTEIIAADVMVQMKGSERASPDAFRERMSSNEALEMLVSKVSRQSYVGEIMVFDADGQLINSSSASPLPAANIRDRVYFKR